MTLASTVTTARPPYRMLGSRYPGKPTLSPRA